MAEDDDDILQLPADTLAVLREFNEERDLRAKQFADLQDQAESDFAAQPISMEAFTEDWNASQFWYSDETARTLAQQLLRGATNRTGIAVVSAPSVFVQLKTLLAATEASERPKIVLFEYDERFAVFKQDFVHYDFQQPLKLPAELKGSFDRLICDPPFLSEDCQTKAALTVRWLCKSWSLPSQDNKDRDSPRVILCTGERMQSVIEKLYEKAGVRTTTLEVRHAKVEVMCIFQFALQRIPIRVPEIKETPIIYFMKFNDSGEDEPDLIESSFCTETVEAC